MSDIKMILFKQHRQTANCRGIPFKFTYEQWCAWWEANLGTDWQSKRGRKKNQYVMARNRDVGPYAAWNVKCKLATLNSSEANIGRRKNNQRLGAVDARQIYVSGKPNTTLAKEYGVAVSVIERIKQRVTWAEETKGLISPPRSKGSKGENRWSAVLSEKEVVLIRRSTKSRRQLAKEYGVQYMAISNIQRRKTWKHVP